MSKWWRQHAIRKDFVICTSCTGKVPIEVAERSKTCPFCHSRSKDLPNKMKKMMEQAGVETDGALKRIQEKK